MTVVKINAIAVSEGRGEELEARFEARARAVDGAPGFEELMVLRPLKGEDRYFVVTRWASEEAFQAWRSSEGFQRQHRKTHEDGGRGPAKAEHPVVAEASLLEFEVVSRSARNQESS